MSESAESSLTTAWAVCVKSKRGTWWTSPEWMGRTRKEAIAFYCEGWDDEVRAQFLEDYTRAVRNGEVKCIRVNVTEAAP